MASSRKGAIPLYHQIFLILRDEILSGQRPFGSPVPTEQELGAQYSVSRITARRALDELAQAGLVERRRRTGTRVIHQSPARPVEADIDQAVESLLAAGSEVSVQLPEVAIEAADPSVAERLRLEDGEQIIYATRLCKLDGAPLGEISHWLPLRFQHLVNRRNLADKSTLTLLHENGVKFGNVRQIIEARVADPRLAGRLAVEARAPLLRIERLVEDDENRPVLLTVAHYRADRYRIGVDSRTGSRMVPAVR